MKTSPELRRDFLSQFNGKKVTREEIEEFLEPYFEFNPEAAYKQALAKAAREFISSFRDDRQVRECFGFELDGQMAFAFIERLYKPSDLPILEKIKDRLTKQIKGIIKSKEKVEARIWIIENQLTIYDYMTPLTACGSIISSTDTQNNTYQGVVRIGQEREGAVVQQQRPVRHGSGVERGDLGTM